MQGRQVHTDPAHDHPPDPDDKDTNDHAQNTTGHPTTSTHPTGGAPKHTAQHALPGPTPTPQDHVHITDPGSRAGLDEAGQHENCWPVPPPAGDRPIDRPAPPPARPATPGPSAA
ncbi:hypothetical protein ACFCY8_33850 [Streptomyces noursei]|uniref:hypothetical protein n=1 Tax=Streptomyces noursei TaxID=1971 RepID=UPI0035DC5B64